MQGEPNQANRLSFVKAVAMCSIATLATTLMGGCSAARVQQIDDGAAEGRTEQMIESVANDMRSRVPKTYANGIVWNSTRRNGYEIENLLTLPPHAKSQGKQAEISSIVKDAMASSLCRRADAKRLMYHGMKIRMIVNDHEGSSVTNKLITHADC